MVCVMCQKPYGDTQQATPQADPSSEVPIVSRNESRDDLKRLDSGPKPTEPIERNPAKSWDGKWHRIE
jgi:hypothetical protein